MLQCTLTLVRSVSKNEGPVLRKKYVRINTQDAKNVTQLLPDMKLDTVIGLQLMKPISGHNARVNGPF